MQNCCLVFVREYCSTMMHSPRCRGFQDSFRWRHHPEGLLELTKLVSFDDIFYSVYACCWNIEQFLQVVGYARHMSEL